MSDSEDQQQVEIQDEPQENQPHIKEILSKGKQIAPFYDEADLFQLFKSYFSVDYLFYQQLEIIAKRRNSTETNDGEWISVGKKHIGTTHRQEEKTRKISKARYNFLEDKQLIARAENFEKQLATLREKRERIRSQPQQYKEKEPQKNPENYKQEPKRGNKYQQKNQNTQNSELKPKYKPKQEQTQAKEIKKEPQPTKNGTGTPKKIEYALKAEPKVQTTVLPQVPPQKQPEPQPSKSTVQVPEKQKQKADKLNTSQKVQKQIGQPQYKEKTQPEAKIEQKPKPNKLKYQEKSIVVETTPISQPKPKQSNQNSHPATQTQVKITQIKQSEKQIVNLSESQKIYQQNCAKNPLLLSFVSPKAVVQRVSYIRFPDGKYAKISIRETRPAKQG